MPIPSPEPPVYSTEDCTICHKRLLVPPRDDELPGHVIDDIELRCGHHFHWSCFGDYDRASPANRTKCPKCNSSTLTADGILIAKIRNEGGFVGSTDLGEDLDESRWKDSQPDSWKLGQNLLSLCQFMEYDEAEALLRDEGVDPNAAYEDGTTGLHMAALNDSVDWASLLLRYGADKHRKNDGGKTPLDYAREAKARNVINLLR